MSLTASTNKPLIPRVWLVNIYFMLGEVFFLGSLGNAQTGAACAVQIIDRASHRSINRQKPCREGKCEGLRAGLHARGALWVVWVIRFQVT